MQDKDYTSPLIDEVEEWGDDELTAIDLSAAFLLERADWTSFYNGKGYDGSYPFLLYAYDDADVLNDRLMAEVNRTQVLSGHNKLQVDLFTKFTDYSHKKVVGMVWMEVSGTRSIAPDLKEDLIWLFRSGATEYIQQSYNTHGKVVEIKWYDEWNEVPIASLFEDNKPPKANLDRAEYIKYATLVSK